MMEQGKEFSELAGITFTELRPRFSGTYSDVHIGRFGDKIVAVKIIKHIRDAPLETMQRKITRERKLWAAFNHSNIVPFYGYAEDEKTFGPLGALISPWYENGDAARFLAAHGKDMDILARSTLWMGVIAGVHYLHSYSPVIVHGDLKPLNILIDDQRNPRVCDFGISRMLTVPGTSGLTTTSPHTGTVRYLSYELIEDTCVPTTASDVYALACTGLEFICQQIPHATRPNNVRGQIFRDIQGKVPPAVRPDSASESLITLWKLFESCWAFEPASRPSVKNVMAAHKDWHVNYPAGRQPEVSTPDSGTTNLFSEGPRSSFDNVDLLFPARSDHGAVQVILHRVHEARTKYAVSLSESIQAAKPSHTFANRAQDLCAALAEGQETSDEFIHSSITEMRKISQGAHATAKTTLDVLSANRQELAEIRASTLETLKTIETERMQFIASRDKAASRADAWKQKNLFFMGKGKHVGGPLQIAKTAIYLPAIAVTASGAQVFKKQAEGYGKKVASCEKALQNLEPMEKGLERLMVKTDSLAQYWLEVDTTLQDIYSRVEELREDNMLQMRIQGLYRDWKEVGAVMGPKSGLEYTPEQQLT